MEYIIGAFVFLIGITMVLAGAKGKAGNLLPSIFGSGAPSTTSSTSSTSSTAGQAATAALVGLSSYGGSSPSTGATTLASMPGQVQA